MSESSAENTSSGLTSGRVFRTGIVKPSFATGALLEPGSSSMNMSFSPVFGRSSAVASSWTMFLYSGSIVVSTIARRS